MQLLFKKCTMEDVEDLTQISKSTFITAFESVNNPKDFKDYIEFAFNKVKLREELQNTNASFYFVYLNQDLAAYFKLNEFDSQTDIKAPEGLEIERIYVHPDYQGRKIGSAMLQEIKKIAVKNAKEFLWLGVWEHNTGAVRFYERAGFTKFGTHPYYIGTDKQTDWLMRLSL